MIRMQVGTTLVAILLATAGAVRAQPAVDLKILNAGKPVGQVDVSAFLDAGKVVVGTTNATGDVTITSTATGFIEGDRIEVWVRRCEDGEVEIILVREGGDDPCADEDAAAGEDCGCDKIGLIIWGDGPATIDIGRGNVTQTRTGRATTPGMDHSFADAQIGAMIGYSSFYQFKDVSCDQPGIVSCEADDGAIDYGAYLDWKVKGNWGLSFEAHYSKLEVTQTFASSVSTIDVNSWFFQGAGVYSVPLSPRAGWFARLGYAVAYDDGKFETRNGATESGNRSETGSRLVLGSGFHFPIGDKWCTRLNLDWTTGFDSNDADTNVRSTIAVGYRWDREGGAR